MRDWFFNYACWWVVLSVATSVNTKLSGSLCSMVCSTGTLQEEDDVCLRFLQDAVSCGDVCEFIVSDVNEGSFPVKVMDKDFELKLHLWLHGTGNDFFVWVECRRGQENDRYMTMFFLPLWVLKIFHWHLFAIHTFSVLCTCSVSLLSHLHSTIFCSTTFSQQVSSHTSLVSPSSVTMQLKSTFTSTFN